MVYRLGKRARLHRLRRAWRQRRVRLGVFGLLGITLVGLVSMRPAPNNLAQALGLSGSPAASGQPRSSQASHPTGSSAPPPKGTLTTNDAAEPAATSPLRTAGCNVFPSTHPGLSASIAPELRKLAQYEQACSGAVAQRTSIFVPTPSSTAQAQASAQAVAGKLRAYDQAGISPLVFMEPTDPNGCSLDLAQYASGTYDTALSAYYQALHAAGVTSSMMGMWVYLPEGNLPVWSTTDPAVFTAVVAKMARLQKQYFPGSQVSIMLDSESYAPGAGWGSGSYASLLPYVQGMPGGLIDSFGLQGFPWAAPADQPSEGSLYNPKVYLRTDLATQAARALGVSSIWFNTGTFAEMYANQPGRTMASAPAQRQQMLGAVVQQAQEVKLQGFTVAIHLFAQNKASLGEGTDWSYWQVNPGDKPDTATFTTFASDAHAAGIPLWLYDSE